MLIKKYASQILLVIGHDGWRTLIIALSLETLKMYHSGGHFGRSPEAICLRGAKNKMPPPHSRCPPDLTYYWTFNSHMRTMSSTSAEPCSKAVHVVYTSLPSNREEQLSEFRRIVGTAAWVICPQLPISTSFSTCGCSLKLWEDPPWV